MNIEKINYQVGSQRFEGMVANPLSLQQKPAVLLVHDWSGRNDFAEKKIQALAELGYVGFAVDMYGEGKQGQSIDEKMALMSPLLDDRRQLLSRMMAALTTVKSLPYVDSTKVAVMGYCFGGLCALDLARSGAELSATISFHGLLNAPEQPLCAKLRSRLLVLHGQQDPMVPQSQVEVFIKEMQDKNADWELHSFGQAKHAFTNPLANDKAMGTVYNPSVAKRAWTLACNFLSDSFS